MGFFNFFSREQKSSSQKGSSLFVTTKASKFHKDTLTDYKDGGSSLAKSSEENFFHTSELIFSCVDYIGKAASQAIPKIGKVDADNKFTPLPNKDKLSLWAQNPNPFFTWGELIELQIQALLLSGTSFITMELNKGKWESWFLGSPSTVKIVPHAQNYINGVIWKEKIAYKSDEVCIIRNPTLNNIYYGVPAVRPLLDTLLLESYAIEDLKSFYENSSLLTGLLESEYALSPEQTETIQSQFQSLYGKEGTKRGGTAVLPSGLKYNPIQSSPQDAKILDSLQISDKRVLRVFKINALALGGENTSNSHPQELMKAVFNTAVRPYLYKIEDNISLFLQTKFKDSSLRFILDLDRVVELETSLEVKSTAAKTSYSTGLSSLNEARNMIGLPKVAAENADKNILAAYLFGVGAQYVQDGTPVGLATPGQAPTAPVVGNSGNSTESGGAGSTSPDGGAADLPTAGV